MKSLSFGEMASSRGSHWHGVWIVSKDREDGIRNRTQHFLMMPVITWKKKFHTVGPAQVLTWHHESVSVIENLLPHSAYIDYVPGTALGLRMAKLNTSSLCSPTPSLWTCTGSCLLYLAEGRPGSPGQKDALDPPFPLTVSSSVSPRLLSPLSLFRVRRRALGGGPTVWFGHIRHFSRWPPFPGLEFLSLHGSLKYSLFCDLPCSHSGFGDVIFRDGFSVERCHRWYY